MIEFRIDYVQFSAKASSVKLPLQVGHGWDFRSNMQFYKTMKKYDNGLVVYEGNPNSDKKLFVFSGKACDNVNFNRDTFDALLQFKPKYSRLDLAMTCDFGVLSKIMSDKDKVVSKKFPKGKVISDLDYTPETIYFGDLKKRADNGIVRCYDKALQLKLDDIVRQRIEVEFRKDDADIASRRVHSGESIPSVMNSRFRIDSDWYKEIFGSDVSTKRFKSIDPDELSEIERKMLWLHKQVVPTLNYVIEYDKANGTSNFKSLIDRLMFDVDYDSE